jgi:hypothetical protein
MQYNNESSISNRLKNSVQSAGGAGIGAFRTGLRLAAIAAATFALSACSDSLTAGQPDNTFATESKAYAKALTPEAKKMVISAMQQERDLKAASAGKPKAKGEAEKSQN